jgi:WD40 repeat protein
VLWEIRDNGLPKRGRPLPGTEIVWQVAFSPDQTARIFAVASGSGSVRLWKWDGEKPERLDLMGAHKRRVNALAFSPDGRLLLTGSIDKTARLWDARTGQPVGKPLRHPGGVWPAVFIDAHTVATGCRDGAARLWDARIGIPIGPPLRHTGVVWALSCGGVNTHRGGPVLVTGSEDKTARLWQLPAPVQGRVEQIARWVQVMTALELDDQGTVRPLEASRWETRRRQLKEPGGPPLP